MLTTSYVGNNNTPDPVPDHDMRMLSLDGALYPRAAWIPCCLELFLLHD